MDAPDHYLGWTAPEPGVPTLRVPCPDCNARPGAACTTPTDTGRKPMSLIHNHRVPRQSYPVRLGGTNTEGWGPEL